MIKIKETRERLKLKQKEVCSALGIAQNTLSQYESGKREPDNETLKRIADYFNVSLDYLLGRTDELTSPSVNEQLSEIDFALYSEVKNLTNEEKEKVVDFVRFTKSQRFKHPNRDIYIAATGGHILVPGSEETSEQARRIIDETFDDEE